MEFLSDGRHSFLSLGGGMLSGLQHDDRFALKAEPITYSVDCIAKTPPGVVDRGPLRDSHSDGSKD